MTHLIVFYHETQRPKLDTKTGQIFASLSHQAPCIGRVFRANWIKRSADCKSALVPENHPRPPDPVMAQVHMMPKTANIVPATRVSSLMMLPLSLSAIFNEYAGQQYACSSFSG
ncbi:hypothetical protein, partial [Acidithiobacillus sp.]